MALTCEIDLINAHIGCVADIKTFKYKGLYVYAATEFGDSVLNEYTKKIKVFIKEYPDFSNYQIRLHKAYIKVTTGDVNNASSNWNNLAMLDIMDGDKFEYNGSSRGI